MADESAPSWEKYNQVKEESIERRVRIKELEARVKEMESEHAREIETLTKERDEAKANAEEIAEAYETFTSESELHKTIEGLRGQIRKRELTDTIRSVEGADFHAGVTFEEIIAAAGVAMPGVDDELPEGWASSVVEKARTNKAYLFAPREREAGTTIGADAPKETAVPQAVRAFGAQAVGGGAAAKAPQTDPAKAVDWSNPVAVTKYVSS